MVARFPSEAAAANGFGRRSLHEQESWLLFEASIPATPDMRVGPTGWRLSNGGEIEDEDRLSTLTDDVLLSILGRVDTRTAARTSALSTRWRRLPWLLPELSIDVKDFLSSPHLKPIKTKDMEEAMASLAKATRSFLLWMQPEMKQLCPAFNKLRKLFVRGIFVEFDILWTMAFLAAAPSIEMLHIEVWDHVCDVGEVEDDYRRQNNTERRTPQWEVDFNDTKNWILKELEFIGFRSLEQQFTFIRSVLQRSPNLHKIVLKRDDECDLCAAHGALPSKFPKKDEQEMIMRRIRDGIFSPQIVFDEYSERRRRM
ncbi:uncharacterized protein [Triticum aestivum]|uniref:uncharacterized protein n=1 Tax=Triticum aestivum TaxID=4565 RepID=UPI001D02171C|nr:uncharacterized protein LOC123115284 [Triticum aestivum]